ncbi:MAG: hypothetical protein C5B48_14110 [Candidatus Rokuibacteriota bacterium]|nr:MAG: hypothetical protein C5B48_14110 [Candidatus Rokubacteria bacterium]
MITRDRDAVVAADRAHALPGLRSFHVESAAPRPPLRVGLLLDGPECPRFVARIIEDIAESQVARLELIVYQASAAAPAARLSRPRRYYRALRDRSVRRLLLYDLYVRVDGRRFGADDDPLAPVDCRARLAGVETIAVEPLVKGFTHRIAPADLDRIRSSSLDVLLRFGFNILRGDILTSARYGVWSFHHGDNDDYRGGPAGFWELYEGNPVSGVMLQVLTDELDAGLVLCKSQFETIPGASLSKNRYGPYWGSTHFVIRKLHELHRYGWEHVRSRALAPAPYRGRRPAYRRPGNLEMAGFLGRALTRSVLAAVRVPRHPRWRLAVRMGARPLHSAASTEGFAWSACPPGHSHRDPSLMARDGTAWVFFRDESAAVGRGVIACAEICPSGALGPTRACLTLDRDLAYPMTFETGGEAFMIPGSPAGGPVELYRATDFPYEWTLETTLSRACAVNTTVCHAAGRWWFFTAVAEPPGHCAALLLFHAASLTAQWAYHPANPLGSDARTVRGAGGIFEVDGRLIRPSLAVSPQGERRLALNEIAELTPETYRERPMLAVEPVRATRVYTRWAGIEVIDGVFSRTARTSFRRGAL